MGGMLLEKARIPWIFASLVFGVVLSVSNPFADITSSQTFITLAQLGMYFLLFVIGFEINISDFKKSGRFIIKSTFFIIFLEALFGTAFIYLVFRYDLLVSFLAALSFATVGEAILIPILDEFRMVNTRLGQTIIGIGTLDDMIEVLALVLVVALVGSGIHSNLNLSIIFVSLLALFLLTISLTRLKRESMKFSVIDIETVFLFTLFTLFMFLGIGEYADTAPLAALIAGISIRSFLPEERLTLIESEVKTMCYGFFAPIFFLWVGASMDLNYLLTMPLLVVAVLAVSNGAKMLGSYIAARKELGVKGSALLGIGLSVRFSTSIVILKLLFDNGVIGSDLYSTIIASSIVFTFLVPFLFSRLLTKWGFTKTETDIVTKIPIS